MKLNNTLLNSQWVKETTKEMRKYFETNQNENIVYQGLQDVPNVVLRGLVTATNAYD